MADHLAPVIAAIEEERSGLVRQLELLDRALAVLTELLPVSSHAPRVEEPEAAQVTASPPKPVRRALPEKVCERDGCDVVFQPSRKNQRYHDRACAKKATNARRSRADEGDFACFCGRTFSTEQGCRVHQARSHPTGAAPKPAPTPRPALKAVPAPATAAPGPLVKCRSCWQKFADPKALADHEARHAREADDG